MGQPLTTSEDHGEFAVIKFAPREQLYTADSVAMHELWTDFDRLQLVSKRVVLFQMPKDYLSPELLDEFWSRARKARVDHIPFGGRARPLILAAADASLIRSLNFLRSIPAITIASCEGAVDFDMLGLLLACRYRICSTETEFVNRTLKRKSSPGSGTLWFLSRMLGSAKARSLYLDEVSLTANEALNLGIVDQLSEPSSLDTDGLKVAQRFCEFDRRSLASLTKACDLVNLDLSTYLELAGTGFEAVPPE